MYSFYPDPISPRTYPHELKRTRIFSNFGSFGALVVELESFIV